MSLFPGRGLAVRVAARHVARMFELCPEALHPQNGAGLASRAL